MTTPNWQPEEDEPELEQLKPKVEYQVEAHIALEGSDDHTWGIAKDTEGRITWKPGEGLIVGTWSRAPSDNLIHVFLETSLQALVNKATMIFADYARKRDEGIALAGKAVKASRTRARTAKALEPEPAPSENAIAISNLRKLFK